MNILKFILIFSFSLASLAVSASDVSTDVGGMESSVGMVDVYSDMAGIQSSGFSGTENFATDQETNAKPIAYSNADPETATRPIAYSNASMEISAKPLAYSDAYKQTADWGKSRVLKATGWTTFGLGAGMLLGSAGWLYGCMLTDTYGHNDRIGINALAIGGLAFVAASVPQLILSAKYARRAKMSAPVSFALGMTTVNTSLSGSQTTHPAIGLSVRF
ncbi:hypothetical protein [uncultured Duncaniella sp.]|uniref:hypothetical protein n=1 Tax=uncultured Duncaniella sp. TaxID=2768039 RepID=UPI0025CFEA73|nr:hypothetical protein [uncultured Duncaniella sp.]